MNTIKMLKSEILKIGVLLVLSAAAAQAAPVLFFTDLDSAPNTGGENNNGAYVSIYGNNFGTNPTVTVGGGQVSIKSNPTTGSPVSPWLWYQKLVIQLGPNAQTGNIVVSNSQGSSNGLPFTVRAGTIHCVSATGSDSNSGVFPSSCWATATQAIMNTNNGDVTYFRGPLTISQPSGDRSVLGIQYDGGVAGAPRALVVYPYETVQIIPAQPGNEPFAIHGTAYWATQGGKNIDYWTIAGFTVNTQGPEALGGTDMNHWRVVGNDFSCPNGDGAEACVEPDNLYGFTFLGNSVHDAGFDTGATTSSKLYHGLYFSTDANGVEVGWSTVHHVLGCRGIQFHSSLGSNQYDISLHDNVIHDVRCDGINMASIDPSKGTKGISLYNNIIYHVGTGPDNIDARPYGANYACINFADYEKGYAGSGTVEVYNNTLYDCGARNSVISYAGQQVAGMGAINKAGSNPATLLHLRNNAAQVLTGELYIDGGGMSQINGSNNLWFGVGAGPAPLSTPQLNNVDPKFTNVATANFTFQNGSPIFGAGANTGICPDAASGWDVGACAAAAPAAPPPPPTTSPCDVNSDGVTNVADVQLEVNMTLGISPCTNLSGTCTVVSVQRVVNAALGGACVSP